MQASRAAREQGVPAGPTTLVPRARAGGDRVRIKTSGGLYLSRHEKRLEFLRNVRGPVRNVEIADHEDEHLDEHKRPTMCISVWREVGWAWAGLGHHCASKQRAWGTTADVVRVHLLAAPEARAPLTALWFPRDGDTIAQSAVET